MPTRDATTLLSRRDAEWLIRDHAWTREHLEYRGAESLEGGFVGLSWADDTFPSARVRYLHPDDREAYADQRGPCPRHARKGLTEGCRGCFPKSLNGSGENGLALARPAAADGAWLLIEGIGQSGAGASWAPAGVGVMGMSGCRGVHGATTRGPATDLSWARGADVYVFFDADRHTNKDVAAAALSVPAALYEAGAREVFLADVPGATGKEGLDDVLARTPEHLRTKAVAAAIEAAAPVVKDSDEDLLPAPDDPCDVARTLSERLDRDGKVWRSWRGDWYAWDGACYAPLHPSAVTRWLYLQTESAFFEDERGVDTGWKPTSHKINEVETALALLDCYVDPATEPARRIACRNGVVNVARRTLTDHDPRRFSLLALPFDFDPSATAPKWRSFLSDVLPPDQISLLQQWFGYVVSGDTSRQKILSLVGEKRSGKGTIGRIMVRLLGQSMVTSPTIGSLATDFGLAPLIGKSLALIGDARWTGIRDLGQAVERLKGISGEDDVTANRKNRDHWNGRLGVRFMIMSNDPPSFTDASAALADRMLNIQTRQSFAGREDLELENKLVTELPGILNWALDGLAALERSGRFVVPDSSAAIGRDLALSASPMLAWADAEAELDHGYETTLRELHDSYLRWAKTENIAYTMTSAMMGKQLRSAFGGAIQVLARRGQSRTIPVMGIRLLPPEGRPSRARAVPVPRDEDDESGLFED
jgi:putative DNA primase/helicase